MRRISLWFLVCLFAAGVLRAQDSGTQQQIDQINGRLQDLIDAQALQAKRLDALEKEIGDLRDKSGGTGVSPEDLQKLADQVQEIDKKRQEDRELILKEIAKLGKVSIPSSGRRSTPNVTTNTTTTAVGSSPPAGGKENGYEYKVAAGDTLMIIAKAYRDQGIKVTAEQILKANPGLDPKSLKVGQKIFIPAPAQ
jgi:LysM repeat protein